MAYKRQNSEYVKKYQAYSYAFCKNNDEELPSGTNFDDLCAYIWKEAWKSETKGEDYESDEFEEMSSDNDDSPEQKGNSKGSKSSQTKNKDIPSRGYIPKCWFTYFFLVIKHSRINNDLFALFSYTGKLDDLSCLKSRKQEREERLQKNQQNRKFEVTIGFERGINVEEKESQVILGLRRSKQARDEFLTRIHHLLMIPRKPVNKLNIQM